MLVPDRTTWMSEKQSEEGALVHFPTSQAVALRTQNQQLGAQPAPRNVCVQPWMGQRLGKGRAVAHLSAWELRVTLPCLL